MTVQLDPKAIGLRIRSLRIAAGYPVVAQFARRVGLESKTIHRIEDGLNIPSAETLASIAGVLGCQVDAILFGDSPEAQAAAEARIAS